MISKERAQEYVENPHTLTLSIGFLAVQTVAQAREEYCLEVNFGGEIGWQSETSWMLTKPPVSSSNERIRTRLVIETEQE